jgi:glucosylceramidase
MSRTRISITSLGLAVLFAACGGGSTTTPQGGSGGSESGGSGGNESGGSGGNESGGSGGSQGGGSGGNQGGGSGGNQGGGSGGNQSGGSGGNARGGSAGNQNGGAAGNSNGGSGGSAKGGSAGNQNGGAAGNPNGGAAGTGSGGTTTGAGGRGGAAGATTTGSGGAAAGGTQGTGGSTPSGPAVYTSNNGSCVSGSAVAWTPGTISTSTANATVTVNDSSPDSRKWEGFGGCFNEKGWSYLQQLNSGDRDRAMQLLFAADGANFNIGRIPMGASDYALARYTDDEGGTDTAMANFNTTQDEKNIIPYIKAALAVKSDIRFWASPWTPPTWMKTGPFTAVTDDNATTSSNFDSGNMADSDANLSAYAQYFVKFIAAYKAAGINITMVAPQNEPNYALHYPSCLWTGSLFAKFVGKHLGPALPSGVGVMLGTLSNSDSGKDVDLGNTAMNDSSAKGFFKVAGVQWNVLDKVNSGTTFGSLNVWATEHKCGNYPWNPSGYPSYNSSKAPNDQAYGVESWGYIRDAINKGKVTAYNAWNMVLDTVGNGIDTHRAWNQDALLAVNTSSKSLVVTPAYCVFRHFSQFVAVNAQRISASGGDAVAFKNPDGSLVAVMYNSGSANSSYVVSIGGQKLQFSMPAQGWATVVYKP